MTLSGCSILDDVRSDENPLLQDEKMSSSWRVYVDEQTGLFGYMDKQGDVVIEPKFLEAWEFFGGRAIVKVEPPTDVVYYGKLDEGIFGLINPSGAYVFEPNGLISRVDTWHYLYAEAKEFWPGYGLDGNSVIKYDLIDGLGKVHGETRFYYVHPVRDQLLLANDGNRSYFIDDDGKQLDDYPTFNFPVTAKQEGGRIFIKPLDDDKKRMSWSLSFDGSMLDESFKSETLIEGLTYSTQIMSPYIGISVFYPLFSAGDSSDDSTEVSAVNTTLNQAIIKSVNTYQITDFSMNPEEMVDYNQIDKIDYTAKLDYSLSVVGNVLNYETVGYWYGFGAAHPNSIWSTRHFDLSTGVELPIESFFHEDMDWRLAIAKIIDGQFMADENAFLYIDKNTPEPMRLDTFSKGNFNINFKEDVMIIYYPLYEIAPYAAWYPTYEINYNEMDAYINKKSAIYQALFNE
jgi:hypothetical protein